MNNKNIIEYIITISLGLYLFGFLINGLTFIKNVGLYSSILFFLLGFFIKKNNFKLYKEYYKNNSLLFQSLFIFIISILVSVIFSYSEIKPTIKEFRVEFLNISIFMLISLSILNKKLLYKTFVYVIISAFIYNIVKYGYDYYIHNPNLNFSIRLNRNSSIYFEILYPFILASLFIIRNKLKYLIFLILFIGLFELLLTGARGAWISIIFETVLFIILLVVVKREYLKKSVLIIGSSILFISAGVFYLYQTSNLVKTKLNQGIHSSGRDIIIKTRLPIFLNNGNLFIGIGGPGNYQYNKFLNDYNAPKQFGNPEGRYFHYWSDEPFLLQVFYKEGIFGLLTFLFLSFLLIYKGYKYLKSNYSEEYKFFVISIITSYIGYYFIRGLVEGRNFKYILMFLTLYLIVKGVSDENSISISRKITR